MSAMSKVQGSRYDSKGGKRGESRDKIVSKDLAFILIGENKMRWCLGITHAFIQS